MRYNNYLTEHNAYNKSLTPEIIKELEKVSPVYIDSLKKLSKKTYNIHLFRGTEDRGDYFIRDVRQDRRPKDSDIRWHNSLDDAFFKKWGIRPRSQSLFCEFGIPEGYSRVYVVLPIGDYTLVSSTMVFDAYGRQPSEVKDYKQEAVNLVKLYKKNTSVGYIKNLVYMSGKKHTEVMMVCKSYLALHTWYQGDIWRWLHGEL